VSPMDQNAVIKHTASLLGGRITISSTSFFPLVAGLSAAGPGNPASHPAVP
jgi:hypothetical protein